GGTPRGVQFPPPPFSPAVEPFQRSASGGNDFVLSLLLEPGRIGVHRGLEIGLVAVAVATKRGIEVGGAESLRCGAATQSVRSRLRSGRRPFRRLSLLRRRGGQDRAQGARTWPKRLCWHDRSPCAWLAWSSCEWAALQASRVS